MTEKYIKYILLVASLIISLTVSYYAWINNYSIYLPFLWLFSLILFIFSQIPRKIQFRPGKFKPIELITAALFIILPAAIRIANHSPDRIHGDDILTAYFSTHYHPLTTNFFSGIPPDKAAWVARFPTAYFLLQKIFFAFTGTTLTMIKLSVIPYVLIISITLYLIAKKMTNHMTALTSLVIYAFMPSSLYLETLGLHFVSSTAFYMLFIFFLVASIKKPSLLNFSFTGICCGLCFLSYPSSYIALPVLVVTLIALAVVRKKLIYLSFISAAILGLVLTISPFIAYAYKWDNYFTQRLDQVTLLTGSWSRYRTDNNSLNQISGVVGKNLELSARSLVQDHIGGHGGYNFGNLAFFNIPSLVLFAAGLIISLFMIRKKPPIIIVLMTIITTFISGMVMTIPPPAFHRICLTFPFIALISSLPFYMMLKFAKKLWLPAVYFSTVLILTAYSFTGQQYYLKQVKTELENPDIQLSGYINRNFPGRHLHIAAFPGYTLEKIYYFAGGNKSLSVDTAYHRNYLNSFNPEEKYIYVIIYPEDFNAQFSDADTKGKIIPYSDKYSLFVN